MDARQVDAAPGRVHDHELHRPDLALAGIHLLDADDVLVRRQLDIVEDAHRGHDEAHVGRHLAAQRLDLVGEAVGAALGLDERQEAVAEFDLEIVDLQHRGDRLLGGRGRRGGSLGDGRGFGLAGEALGLLPQRVGGIAGEGGKAGEGDEGDARQEGHGAHDASGETQRFRIAGQLLHHGLVGRAGDTGLGDEQARCGRDDEGRDLADEAVADGEDRVGAGGLHEGHALLRHADDQAGDDIDEGDEQAGNGVALHEFRGAVHGAVEGALVLQFLAAGLRRLLVDEAGRQIGVDRHLLAGHGVEGEARRDFGDAPGALRDDHEVHDDEDGEDDDADDEGATHHEIAEGLDDVAGGRRALVPCDRMRRVEARFSASRSIVAMSSTVGKDENSSGLWMNSAVMRIMTEEMIDTASIRSRMSAGSGKIRMIRMPMTPAAIHRSGRRSQAATSPADMPMALAGLAPDVTASVMRGPRPRNPERARQDLPSAWLTAG